MNPVADTFSRRQILVGLAALVACGDGTVDREKPGMHELTDRIRGLNRTTHVYIPEGLKGPAPMVVVLHDQGVDPLAFAETSGWRAMCDQRGWVGIFPANDRTDYKADNSLIAHMLRRASAMAGGDILSVYLAGHGAGGRRAYAFICSNPGLVLAIATVGAPVQLSDDYLGPQDPQGYYVPILHLHGAKDPIVPIAGGEHVAQNHVKRQILPLKESLAPWIAHIEATEGPVPVTGLPATVKLTTWVGKRALVLAVDPGLAHEWPDYATTAMADFFVAAPPRD